MLRKPHRPLTEINITNLVDVTLVLLIIFMITAPLMHSGIKVDLPQTQSSSELVREGVMVSYTAEEQIYIDGTLVRSSEFESQLIKAWIGSGRKPVMLSADQAIPYGKVIQVVDRIKSAGINNLGLIVENKPKTP
jgi:biopolymer transport protein TolR